MLKSEVLSSSFILFLSYCFGYSGSSASYQLYNQFINTNAGILTGIQSKFVDLRFLVYRFRRTGILKMSFPIYEHKISLNLFSSLISFIRVLWFSSYRSDTCFIRFIPKCFVWGKVNINAIVF